MLLSQKITRRQSQIREQLAFLAGIDAPTVEQRSELGALDAEYGVNEQRFRAALIAEDAERRDAAAAMGEPKATEWGELVGKFELRQALAHLDEGRALDGATAEVVQELRSSGGYRGVAVPLEILEQRAGETVAAGVVNPVDYKPLIHRLFPSSVAGRMGGQMISIGRGIAEYPLVASAIRAGWADGEMGDVAGPQQFKTSSKTLAPHHTLGVQLVFTRRALLSLAGIEEAARADIRNAIQVELDRAVFQGTGEDGEPLGVIAGRTTYGYNTSAAGSGGATYADFRAAVAEFMLQNAASGPGDVKILSRPEVWDVMDGKPWDAGSGISEYDRLVSRMGAPVLSHNAMPASGAGAARVTDALLTTSAGGLSPFFIGTWGALDLIRDPYSHAASGQVKVAALLTCDVTVPRPAQLHLLTGIGIPAGA